MMVRWLRGCILGGVWLAFAAPAFSAAPAWTPDDILLQASAGDFSFSPDGRRLLWVRSQMSEEAQERVSHLFVTAPDGTEPVQLTRGEHRDWNPKWSPDGRWIAFRSTRPLPESRESTATGALKPAKIQLWILDAAGGEPRPLARLVRDIEDFGWSDAAHVVFAAAEDPSYYELERHEKKDDSVVVEDESHTPPVRLFRVSVRDGKLERLTTNDDWVDRLWVSPDGRWAVTRHQQSLRYEYDQAIPPRTFLVDLGTGARRELFASRRIVPEEIVWELDGGGFYIVYPVSSHTRYLTASVSVLAHVDLADLRVSEVPLEWPRALALRPSVRALPDGFLAFLAEGVRFRPARYVRSGEAWRRTELQGEHVRHIVDWAVSPDGTQVVYRQSASDVPPRWFRARLEGDVLGGSELFLDLNETLRRKPIPRTEIVRFRGARGDEVEGILSYPLGFAPGRRYPLILAIHGGPAGADLDAWDQSWAYPKVLLNQEGAFVLEVNYHGSGNYGLEWVESIGAGRYYDLEIPDLRAGVAHVVERGLADPDRVATLGWSNGAILSIELTTRDPGIKAASAGAGDVEWISDWGNVDFGAAFDQYYFGASPLEDPQRYIEKSPFFRLDRVRTPTLIFFGTEDRNVPPSQGWSHFRALQQLGKSEVRFVLFPGEPHSLRKLAHQRRKVEEDLAWFARHLFGAAGSRPEALKPGSPLELLWTRRSLPHVGAALGVAVDGVPVPETVVFEGLQVGRFEVTRAQYAAFEPTYRVAPGTENLPASGIRFEQARAYCRWLSERTGRRYRLPGLEEARRLAQSAGTKGNTLDRWAGYAVNPDDAERLRGILEAVGVGGVLLQEVGRFPGSGPDPVFDLDGNVAEWAVSPDGGGVLIGASADRPADPKGAPGEAGPAYRGFRVVLEDAVSARGSAAGGFREPLRGSRPIDASPQ